MRKTKLDRHKSSTKITDSNTLTSHHAQKCKMSGVKAEVSDKGPLIGGVFRSKAACLAYLVVLGFPASQQ